MEPRSIKIHFKENIQIDFPDDKELFKLKLVNTIKEVLNTIDIEDFYVYDSGNVQEIILQIDNQKSDR
ncbi:hypothetical protein D0817_20295 [Flavobacterium cupreum]|uniref:Uncharacterized protein n=1 Tax=Flavobacterium cupreum TaxID=2133766 RepID=A0A434A2S4_9FLAO|nr:hypothetical protein [Flavobacterium cupreum]RUT68703.1 hypothetical protein D0817_20295 [Flavobacterium cupreum]